MAGGGAGLVLILGLAAFYCIRGRGDNETWAPTKDEVVLSGGGSTLRKSGADVLKGESTDEVFNAMGVPAEAEEGQSESQNRPSSGRPSAGRLSGVRPSENDGDNAL